MPTDSIPLARPPHSPAIGLALGGGGARGLAHIVLLEAFDELGIRPSIIAGTSMGAIVGAAYAAGLTGREIRAHSILKLRKRSETMARLLRARVGRFAEMFSRNLGNPMLVDGEILLDLFWPEAVPDRFEELAIPFLAVATDFVARCEVTLDSGPLATAVAGSMALPALVKPVEAGGMILIDGGTTNPLPHDRLFGRADIVIACDVMGGAVDVPNQSPSPLAVLLGAAQIMQTTIAGAKLRAQPPDLLLQPDVGAFRALDFFKIGQILRAAEPIKDEFKREVTRLVEARSLA